MKIVAIVGCSASGKTTLAKLLNQSLGNDYSDIIPLDSYYKSHRNLTLEERNLLNYDNPNIFDFDLLNNQLNLLKDNIGIDLPIYDYTLHDRSEETIRINPKKYIILEGILVLHDPKIRSLIDFSAFLDVPLNICYERRQVRDIAERGRTAESVLSQWNSTVKPMYEEFCEPTKKYADLIMSFEERDEWLKQVMQQVKI